MVNEREPPRLQSQQQAAAPPGTVTNGTIEPTFGKPSLPRNSLRRNNDPYNMFNIPKANKPRPEHHKPCAVTAPKADIASSPASANELGSNFSIESPSLVEISKPADFEERKKPTVTTAATSLYELFSFDPVNEQSSSVEFNKSTTFTPQMTASSPPPEFQFNRTNELRPSTQFTNSDIIDLTREDDVFDPRKALDDERFGAYDPYNYVEAAQANENIKALLEGNIDEDEEDKPQRILRKRNPPPEPKSLAEKLQKLEVQEQQLQIQDEEDDGTVEGLSVKLLPHQVAGLSWMIDKEIGKRKKNGVLPQGGILADDMGLGKTIQALSLILCNPRPALDAIEENKKRKISDIVARGTLVVAPLALIKQWEFEIKSKIEKNQELKVLVHHGSSRTKKFEMLKKYDVVITTYQTLSSEYGDSSPLEEGLQFGLFGVHWYRVILDEAHSIKNCQAKMSKAAYALRAVYRWCLTGTPMQNNLDELQSLIHFLRIKPYDELRSWRDQITGPMKNGRGGLAMKRLQYFLKAFMKRRTKEVLKREGALTFGKPNTFDITTAPDKFRIVGRKVETIVVEFDKRERKFYDGLEARTKKSLERIMKSGRTDYMGALVLLLRLRQTCNHPSLIRSKLDKEKDAMTINNVEKSPQRSNNSTLSDGDDLASLMSGLTVQIKNCDSCGSLLSDFKLEVSAKRCPACENGLEKSYRKRRKSKTSSTVHMHQNRPDQKQRHRKRQQARRIFDSDDEDEVSGYWIGSRSSQVVQDVGRAGGTDNENAEGDGHSLGSEDSFTDDESARGYSKSSRTQHKTGEQVDGSSLSYESSDEDEQASESEGARPPGTKNLIISTKIQRLIEILHRESKQYKFIVFSEFTSMLDIVEPFLRSEGFRFTRYDGSMKNEEREASLERLRKNPRVRILLCSLKCGSLGLNLTAASRVVLLEPFWNPFVEEQAIDRVHRLNQTIDVVVYRLTIADSIEGRILALQEKKRELARAAIEGGKAIGKLSMKDILQLFKRDAEHEYAHQDPVGPYLLSPERVLVPSPARANLPNRIPWDAPERSKSHAPPSTSGASQVIERPKFKIPQSLKSQYYDEVYGRRW